MTSDEIRSAYLRFFESKGHKVIPSASLIPHGDPTLLLTSAGMVQFKPYFLGEEEPPSRRMASCQKCFRTSDIESVGDPTHLTFFEMLGNFSIGDYFKKEAIGWAWEFVREHLRLPEERLWITVFLDDDEAFGYWRELGVPEERILRMGEDTNFWGPAGEFGPCGPCSEIHYDFGEEMACNKAACVPGCDCGRFSEIWNLVFTQYNQDKEGRRTLLPRPNIDTGMGLERVAAIMQGKRSVYDTDLFVPLLEHITTLTGKKYEAKTESGLAMRIVAEHSRGITFLIADGVLPSPDKRGSVLRRILRRAQYFSDTLSRGQPIIAELAKEVIATMGHTYPELTANRDRILDEIQSEVERFRKTLPVGLGILKGTSLALRNELKQDYPKFATAFADAVSRRDYLDLRDEVNNAVDHFLRDCHAWEHALYIGGRNAVGEVLQPIENDLNALKKAISDYTATPENAFANLKADLARIFQCFKEHLESATSTLSGYEAFILYDTYGFPVELTNEIAAEEGFSVDMPKFEQEMEKQRERARASHTLYGVGSLKGSVTLVGKATVVRGTPFVGYHDLKHKSVVVGLVVNDAPAERIEAGQEAGVVLETTPFYGEMGGQVGDTGEICGQSGRFMVTRTVRVPPEIILHRGKLAGGTLSVGDEVEAEVDRERRLDIARNHTATHLLQAGLRQVLGTHIQQRGSLVAPDRLRFDFSHLAAMTTDEIEQAEHVVNANIRADLYVKEQELPYKQAVAEGAIAFFEEKYGETVRVLRVGEPPVSTELCGGTHVGSTGEIAFFHILGEGSIGAGLRRIEALTGRGAEELVHRRFAALAKAAEALGGAPDEVESRLAAALTERDELRRHNAGLEREVSRSRVEALLRQAEPVNGVTVLAARVPPSRVETLREMTDMLRDRLKSAVIVLGTVYEDRPMFIAAVTPDLVTKGRDAGKIVREVAKVTGGGGGGKPTLAQAGGKDKSKLDEALRLVRSLV